MLKNPMGVRFSEGRDDWTSEEEKAKGGRLSFLWEVKAYGYAGGSWVTTTWVERRPEEGVATPGRVGQK